MLLTPMYRENAQPVVETLHTLIVRPVKGSMGVTTIFSVSLISAAIFLVLVLTAAPRYDVELAERLFALAALVFGGIGLWFQTRRRRTFAIVQQGDRHRIVVDGIELEFPITCHGTQAAADVGRGLVVHEIFLQLVDSSKRAIVLYETRGASNGPQLDWPDDMDPTVATLGSYEVSSLADVVKVWTWVREVTDQSRG